MKRKKLSFGVVTAVFVGLFALAAMPAGWGDDDRDKEGNTGPKEVDSASGLAAQAAELRRQLDAKKKGTAAIVKQLQDEKDAHAALRKATKLQTRALASQASALQAELILQKKALLAMVAKLQDEKDAHAATQKAAAEQVQALAAQAAALRSQSEEQQKATAEIVAKLADAKEAHAKLSAEVASERALRKALEKLFAEQRGAVGSP